MKIMKEIKYQQEFEKMKKAASDNMQNQ